MFSAVGDILSTVGDIMSTVGDYLEYRGGMDMIMHVEDIMSTMGGVQYRGGRGNFSLLSLQWTPRTPYGASYMYETHHLNNYHHNSKSIGIIWGFVWDPFKRCFGQLPLYRHCSRSRGCHIGPTVLVQVLSGSFHTVVTTADLAGIVWSSI